ncbi:LCP family protein [Streptomyces sp. NPDC002851]
MTDAAGPSAGPEWPDDDETESGTSASEDEGTADEATDGTTDSTTEEDDARDDDAEDEDPADDDPEEQSAPEENGTTEEGPAEAARATEEEPPGETATTEEGTPADDSPSPAPTPKPRHHWLRWAALGLAVIVLATAGVGWSLYKRLEGNITADTGTAAELERYERERPPPSKHNAQNILLIGSDTRSGKGNRPYGRDPGTQRSDTTILLHLAADRKSATAVSLPRDLMVDIPRCRRPDGSRSDTQFAQFNWAFELGGTACTIRTVEKLTKIRIDHHMVVDFQGFKRMVNAVNGVEVCLKRPIHDPQAKLRLPAGKQKLNGEQALGFVRARKSVGGGSDTERMDRQQQFLAALVNKVRSNGVLLNPTRLFPVLDAATSSLTTDPALSGLTDLYELVRSMRNIPIDRVQFLTVPRRAYTYDPNRDELVQPDAGRLFDRLRADAPLRVDPQTEDSDASGEGEEEGESDGGYSSEGSGGGDYSEYSGDDDGGKESHDDGAGYLSDAGFWVDGTPRDRADGKPAAGPGARADDPSETPSPAPTFRGNTAARTTCE